MQTGLLVMTPGIGVEWAIANAFAKRHQATKLTEHCDVHVQKILLTRSFTNR